MCKHQILLALQRRLSQADNASSNRIRLRQAGPRSGLNLRDYFHLGPANGPYRTTKLSRCAGWKLQPSEIQAADGFCEFSRYNIPVKYLHPILGSALQIVALAYLDACVFLGLDSEALREKINMLLHVISSHGDTWKLSEMIAGEIRFVIKAYLSEPVLNNAQTSLPIESTAWDPSLVISAADYAPGDFLQDPLLSLAASQPIDFSSWDHYGVEQGANWLGISSA